MGGAHCLANSPDDKYLATEDVCDIKIWIDIKSILISKNNTKTNEEDLSNGSSHNKNNQCCVIS